MTTSTLDFSESRAGVQPPDTETLTRRDALRAELREAGSVLVAFSGGVDSSYLAYEAVRTLGPTRTLAVTGASPSVSRRQLDMALLIVRAIRIPWRVIRTRETEDPEYASNPTDRCFFCKRELYDRLGPLAEERGLRVIVDGANADDAGDHRPGMRAAHERDVRSPLLEVGLGKQAIRTLSRAAGLPTWKAPASPCLASRLPYGVAVTPQRLREVEAAEEALRDLGVEGDFRIRHHAGMARIELPAEDLVAWADVGLRRRAVRRLRDIGFGRAVLDLEGFRSGSLNRAVVQIGGDAPERQVSTNPDDEIAVHRLPPDAVAAALRPERRAELVEAARSAGFRFAALDLES